MQLTQLGAGQPSPRLGQEDTACRLDAGERWQAGFSLQSWAQRFTGFLIV